MSLSNITIEDGKSFPDGSALSRVNLLFHDAYTLRKEVIKSDLITGESAIYVRMDDRLIVHQNGNIEEHRVTSDDYHICKALSHLPMAIYLNFESNRQLLVECIEKLIDEALESPYTDIQLQLVDDTRQWLSKIETSSLTADQMLQYSKLLQPTFAQLMKKASNQEIERTVKLLDSITAERQLVSSDIYMVVIGSHQARYKELSKQIFTKWYADRCDNLDHLAQHVHYCEGIENVEQAIDTIVTAVADAQLARLFLGSDTGLRQDALSHVSESYLDQYWQSEKR